MEATREETKRATSESVTCSVLISNTPLNTQNMLITVIRCSVAFSNTATKAIFQVLDQRLTVAKGLAKKLTASVSAERLSQMISTLPRGTAFVISENIGKIVSRVS